MRIATIALTCSVLLACGRLRPSGGSDSSADAGTTSDGFAQRCTGCHGDSTSPAPPADLLGQSDPALRGVGAHRSHLFSTHDLAGPVACETCHAVPTTVDSPGHLDGPWPANVSFSGLALAKNAQPRLSADPGTGDARKDASNKVTCAAVYCHGATLSGGASPSPVWNTPDAKWTACGACHGFPPTTTSSGAAHPKSTSCASCHDQTVSADGTIAHPDKHIDGVVEVKGGGGGCNACHGNASASSAPPGDPNTAPPVDTTGRSDTALITVGAHQSHLKASHGLSSPVACSECHTVPTAVDSPGHNIGQPAAVNFGTLAKFDTPSTRWTPSDATCATYCHGATLGGGSATSPIWNKVDGSQAACGTCHGLPPPAPHPSGATNCAGCHDTVAAGNKTIAKPAQHIDGQVQAGSITCFSCHGTATAANNAPPVDTHGNTATTEIGIGAHQAHLTGGRWSAVIACSECHLVPSSLSHSNGTVDFPWGPIAKAKGLAPSFTSAATCSSTWCHAPVGFGSTASGSAGGTNPTPLWNPAAAAADQAKCGTCHGIPPTTGRHAVDSHAECADCHPGYSGSGNTATVNKAAHIDGTVEVGGTGTSIQSYSNRSCSPTGGSAGGCHDTESWVP